MWQCWVTFILGIWVIVSGIISGFTPWNNVIDFIAGIVIAALGIWVALTKKPAS